MSQVNVTISGKIYRMACDDGQEEHLTALGQRLVDTIELLRGRFGEIGDQRLTVMAAITMADQYSETERRLRQLEAEFAGVDEARAAILERQEAVEGGVAESIASLADRIEALAVRLNDDASRSKRTANAVTCRPLAAGVRGRAALYVEPAKLRGPAGNAYPRGLIDPKGSCPRAGSWARPYGAHLRCRSPGSKLHRPSRLRSLLLTHLRRCIDRRDHEGGPPGQSDVGARRAARRCCAWRRRAAITEACAAIIARSRPAVLWRVCRDPVANSIPRSALDRARAGGAVVALPVVVGNPDWSFAATTSARLWFPADSAHSCRLRTRRRSYPI